MWAFSFPPDNTSLISLDPQGFGSGFFFAIVVHAAYCINDFAINEMVGLWGSSWRNAGYSNRHLHMLK